MDLTHFETRIILKFSNFIFFRPPGFKNFIAGSLAGLTGQSLTYPLDRARAVMAVTRVGEYRNLRDVFSRIIADEQYRGLYRAMPGGPAPAVLRALSLVPEEVKSWQARVLMAARIDSALPDQSDAALLQSLDVWLAPYLTEVTRLRDLAKLDIGSILKNQLTWEQQQQIEKLTPAEMR